jgi:DNA adenine methylase
MAKGDKMKSKPLFMWAGGKSKMLKHYAAIDKPDYDTFVEPFFGGGALFLNENPEHAIINDINSEIIGIYREVRRDPQAFIDACLVYVEQYFKVSDRKAYYYALRSRYWQNPTTPLLYVLMKLGFNGIWQTCKDSNGMFGTPSGLLNQTKVEQIVNSENIMVWSERLAGTEIVSGDYREIVVPDNSFVFLDPPYRDSFTTYGTGFNDADQEEVIAHAIKWSEHSTVWLSNRTVDGDDFFESRIPNGQFYHFDVTYTAGRRKRVGDGHEAKKAREFLCVLPKGS